MTRECYGEQAMANLRVMSRTANGEVDTSASADKKKVMAVSSGDAAKELALRNFQDALDLAWANRYRVFSNPGDLRSFIEDLARQVNQGLLKDGVLYRTADSPNTDTRPSRSLRLRRHGFMSSCFRSSAGTPMTPWRRRQSRNTISILRAMVTSLICTCGIRVAFTFLLGVGLGMGLMGYMWAMCIDWSVKAALMVIHAARGAWKNKRIIEA